MLWPETRILLKNGQEALLRSPVAEDAAKVLETLKTCAAQTHFIIRYPDECTWTLEEEAAILKRYADSAASVMIGCWVADEAVGTCTLSFNPASKVRHRGHVAISLLQKCWGLGIGTAMFACMIEQARAWGLRQLELEFIEGNERARALYEKMGFHIYGERPDGICLRDGTMLKEYLMMLRL